MKSLTLLSKIFILIIIIFQISGCSNKIEPEIAYITPISGSFSTLGNDIREGMEIYLSELAPDFPVKFRVSYYDDKGDSKISLALTQKLLDQGVQYFVFNSSSGASTESINLALKAGVFCFSATVSNSEFTGLKDRFYRTATSNSHIGTRIYSLIGTKDLNSKIIIIEDSANQKYADTIKSSLFEKLDFKTVSTVSFNGNEKIDALNLANKTITAMPQCVIIISNPIHSANIVQNLIKKGFSNKIILAPSAVNSEFIEQCGSAAEGVFAISTSLLDLSDAYKSFKETFLKSQGKPASYFAQYGYDTGAFLKVVFEKANSIDLAKTTEVLNNGIHFQGLISSDNYVNEFGDSEAKFNVYIVHKKQFELTNL